MKELYSFDIKREVEVEVPHVKNVGGKTIESKEKQMREVVNRIVLLKPTKAEVEDAEFFYSQKFNELLNSGFLSRAMLNKKMSDNGGLASKDEEKYIEKLLKDNMESSNIISFFGGAKDLDSEQAQQLEDAKLQLAVSQKQLTEIESAMNAQYNHTADVKAEHKLYEFFIFNFSHYEEIVDDKKQLVPLFKGDDYDERRDFFLVLSEDEEDLDGDSELLKHKAIFERSFDKLIKAVNVWYRGFGKDQESIDGFIKALEEGEKDPELAAEVEKIKSQAEAEDTEEVEEETEADAEDTE
jgi:molybdopterin synthase catalytic subunit